MPWVVGIDEAGYGPNLGPLVQAAVALHLPDDDPAGWDALKPAVRRCHEPDDGRLLIDDSKKVYTRGGLAALERSGYGLFGAIPQSVETYLASHALPHCVSDLRSEYWFDPQESLPLHGESEAVLESCERSLSVAVVPAPAFNRICDEQGSKGAVLSRGLVSLMSKLAARFDPPHPDCANHRLIFHCDKHGGRNFYAAIVQQAFPEGWVIAERESAAESRYRVEGLRREVTASFRPRADAESVAVALASMLAKYLREVFMRQFNRFWAQHVPGLKPTAGYPGDAKRFYAAIREAMEKLGLNADQVWRKR